MGVDVHEDVLEPAATATAVVVHLGEVPGGGAPAHDPSVGSQAHGEQGQGVALGHLGGGAGVMVRGPGWREPELGRGDRAAGVGLPSTWAAWLSSQHTSRGHADLAGWSRVSADHVPEDQAGALLSSIRPTSTG